MRTLLLNLGLAVALSGKTPAGCITAVQAANIAEERIGPATPNRELELLLARLEVGSNNCYDDKYVADAWYYRSVIEQRLGRPAKDYQGSLNQAREKSSQALAKALNPPAAPAASPDAPVSEFIQNKYALVVGINQFQDKSVSGLNYSVADAEAFADALTSDSVGRFQAENVHRLTDQRATLKNFQLELGKIRAKAKPEDLVLIYISSHGSPREMDPTGISYVIMHDTDSTDQATLYATSLQMADLSATRLSRELAARRVILVLDTCFSGAASDEPRSRTIVPASSTGAAAFSGALAGTASGVGLALISASRGDQKSYESEEFRHGFFTYYFLNALKQGNGLQPLGRVFESVVDQVNSAARGKQTPIMSSVGGGDKIILGAAPKNAQ